MICSEKIVKYRESRKGYGSCNSVKWTSSSNSEPVLLIAGFGNGRIASYVLKEDEFYPVGILDIGSPVSEFISSYFLFKFFHKKRLCKTYLFYNFFISLRKCLGELFKC